LLAKHSRKLLNDIYMIALKLRVEMNLKNCSYNFIWPSAGDSFDKEMMDAEVFGHKIFLRGPSIRLVSIAALAQALVGLGTGRSPSSSGCSPSTQALLSRAQSRSSTLSSEPIMPS
jgi:hypothetical protein